MPRDDRFREAGAGDRSEGRFSLLALGEDCGCCFLGRDMVRYLLVGTLPFGGDAEGWEVKFPVLPI
jgi:hypothetical protein